MRVSVALLALTHAACALLFYTNLTRNPYYTQIALLNVGIAAIGILWAIHVWIKGEISIPRFSYEKPMIAFLLVAFASSVWAWWKHPVLRPGIGYETTRVWIFTLVNCLMALYLPGIFTKPLGKNPVRISIWTDIVLSIGWGALWLGFHANKDPDPNAIFWDSYGGFLWIMAAVYVVFRTRRAEAIEFFHLILSIGFLASIYGVMQYAGKDIIWTSLVVPYGGRPVSTFGNPNFLSSYIMMVAPLAFGLGLRAQGKERVGYMIVAFVVTVAVLCTLTRSSYIGLFASLLVMVALLASINPRMVFKFIGVAAGLFVFLIVVFPKTPIFTSQSPLLRFTEVYDAIKGGQVYGPWHQRILIWSSAWDIFHQNFWVGSGWGCFELFYPFFQGKYLFAPVIGTLRTHANNAHNILMEIWAQTGMLGAGFSLWWLAVMVVSGWRIVKDQTEGFARFVAAGLVAALVGMVVDNFFGNVSIFFATPAFLFWWYAGALENENERAHVETRALSTMVGRPLLICFVCFCFVVIVYFFKRWQQEIYYFDGFRSAKMGDIPKSIKSLEKAYEWFPGEVNSNYEWGNSYATYARALADKGLSDEALSYRQKAIHAFGEALRANPGYDEIYFNLGVIEGQNGDRVNAIRNLEISLYINPMLRDAYGALGNLYLQMGDPANAAKVFANSVDAFPNDKDLWNNLGYCYSQLKESRKSFEAYKHAVMIDPSFNQGWQNLGLAARTLDEKKDPILQVPYWIQQMEAAVAKRDFAAALAPAERIAETIPNNADTHLSLGNIYFYQHRNDESEKQFKRAIELNPRFVIAYVNLGRLYQLSGKTAEARSEFDRALAIDPANKEAKDALNSLPK